MIGKNPQTDDRCCMVDANPPNGWLMLRGWHRTHSHKNEGAASPRITSFTPCVQKNHECEFLTAHTYNLSNEEWKEGKKEERPSRLFTSSTISPQSLTIEHKRAQSHKNSHGNQQHSFIRRTAKPLQNRFTSNKSISNLARANGSSPRQSKSRRTTELWSTQLIPPLVRIKPLKQLLARKAVTKLCHTESNKT